MDCKSDDERPDGQSGEGRRQDYRPLRRRRRDLFAVAEVTAHEQQHGSVFVTGDAILGLVDSGGHL